MNYLSPLIASVAYNFSKFQETLRKRQPVGTQKRDTIQESLHAPYVPIGAFWIQKKKWKEEKLGPSLFWVYPGWIWFWVDWSQSWIGSGAPGLHELTVESGSIFGPGSLHQFWPVLFLNLFNHNKSFFCLPVSLARPAHPSQKAIVIFIHSSIYLLIRPIFLSTYYVTFIVLDSSNTVVGSPHEIYILFF